MFLKTPSAYFQCMSNFWRDRQEESLFVWEENVSGNNLILFSEKRHAHAGTGAKHANQRLRDQGCFSKLSHSFMSEIHCGQRTHEDKNSSIYNFFRVIDIFCTQHHLNGDLGASNECGMAEHRNYLHLNNPPRVTFDTSLLITANIMPRWEISRKSGQRRWAGRHSAENEVWRGSHI